MCLVVDVYKHVDTYIYGMRGVPSDICVQTC